MIEIKSKLFVNVNTHTHTHTHMRTKQHTNTNTNCFEDPKLEPSAFRKNWHNNEKKEQV